MITKKRINIADVNTELELLKQEVKNIKSNDLHHIRLDINDIRSDLKVVKRVVFKAQNIMYGAILVFIAMSDKFSDILKLL